MEFFSLIQYIGCLICFEAFLNLDHFFWRTYASSLRHSKVCNHWVLSNILAGAQLALVIKTVDLLILNGRPGVFTPMCTSFDLISREACRHVIRLAHLDLIHFVIVHSFAWVDFASSIIVNKLIVGSDELKVILSLFFNLFKDLVQVLL